ncbi:MAG: SIS domain-containing protein [Proteobacteria bacterium]|nr:SIS domain-containing protein [Pseudomonadota bacterium]
MENLNGHFKKATSKGDFSRRYLGYLSGLLQGIDPDTISQIIDTIEIAGDNGKHIYFIGNGGSAAIASHYANDINVGTRARGVSPIKATSLTDNLALLTAVANDEGYNRVFVSQLEGRLQRGDVVVAFSVSGNSENVLEALDFAVRQGAITIGMTGFDGGRMKDITDIHLHIPTFEGEYGPVEDVFSIVGHLVYTFLKMNRRGKADLFQLHPLFASEGV